MCGLVKIFDGAMPRRASQFHTIGESLERNFTQCLELLYKRLGYVMGCIGFSGCLQNDCVASVRGFERMCSQSCVFIERAGRYSASDAVA